MRYLFSTVSYHRVLVELQCTSGRDTGGHPNRENKI